MTELSRIPAPIPSGATPGPDLITPAQAPALAAALLGSDQGRLAAALSEALEG